MSLSESITTLLSSDQSSSEGSEIPVAYLGVRGPANSGAPVLGMPIVDDSPAVATEMNKAIWPLAAGFPKAVAEVNEAMPTGIDQTGVMAVGANWHIREWSTDREQQNTVPEENYLSAEGDQALASLASFGTLTELEREAEDGADSSAENEQVEWIEKNFSLNSDIRPDVSEGVFAANSSEIAENSAITSAENLQSLPAFGQPDLESLSSISVDPGTDGGVDSVIGFTEQPDGSGKEPLTYPGAAWLESGRKWPSESSLSSGMVSNSPSWASADKAAVNWSSQSSAATTALTSGTSSNAAVVASAQISQTLQDSLLQSDSSADEKAVLSKEFSAGEVSGERRAAASIPLPSISAGTRQPQWAHQFAQRVVVMLNQSVQQAQIALNPEQLGPLRIRLQFDKDQQLQVSVAAQQGAARDAVENALPRLREVLAQSGIQLGSVDIRDDSPSDNRNNPAQEAYAASVSTDSAEEMHEGSLSQVTVKVSKNLVDYYA
ncbi:flagellar hook-length control protein FliK [Thiomicrorhabdus sp.]|uniref:flagellar hook-length control protein FliK n=1 Tax=Thiomicrorhabdus sp. TaxID=2039724 RepID=UPI0029C977A4|nr:flagellar hook-length control protein FliK [Thiomicrorhabdus sp.]